MVLQYCGVFQFHGCAPVCVRAQDAVVVSLFFCLPVASCPSVVLPCCSFRQAWSPVLRRLVCAGAFPGVLQLCLMISTAHANGASFLALVDVFQHKNGLSETLPYVLVLVAVA